MSPTDELGLPPAPPMPPAARDRALQALLDEIDGTDSDVAVPNRHLRWAPLLTAVAVVLVAIVVAVVALSGAHPGPAAPITGPDRSLSTDERPAPTADPTLDAVLLRCATAVARSDRAAQYPPTSTWRSAALIPRRSPVEWALVINDAFGCLVTPTTVSVTGTTGTPLGGVQVVRLTTDELVFLNPAGRWYTIGPPRLVRAGDPGPVMFYQLDAGVSREDLRLSVAGPDGYDGPVPEVAAALTVVDRILPTRPVDAPDGAELAGCLRELPPEIPVYPELWTPVGLHEGGGTEPTALVARLADVAAGFCVREPDRGPGFVIGPLPAPTDRPEPIASYSGDVSAVLVTAPPGVTRVVVAPQSGTAPPVDCTIAGGLAMCTYKDPTGGHVGGGRSVVVTAFTATDPQGIEVHRG